MIEYRDGKQLPPEALEKLFLSIGWESGKEPVLLSKALQNYGAVLTAWEGEELVGLIAAMDDGFLTAYVHYLLVRADRQSAGIGGFTSGTASKKSRMLRPCISSRRGDDSRIFRCSKV